MTPATTPTDALRGKRILVTGGAGFIGSHLVDQLTREPVLEILVLDNFVRGSRENLHAAMTDKRVRVVEGSITDTRLLSTLMQGMDYVAHLAALWLYDCEKYPRTALEVNAVGTYNVVEAAQEAGVAKLVYSSSASVYGEAVSIPMSEEHPFNNRTMYGATKIAGEQFLRALGASRGLRYVGLRYMNVYGPRLQCEGHYVSVVMNMLNRIGEHLPPLVFGDGSQVYDFTYVADAARANILALTSDTSDEFVNIGTGVGTTVKDLVHRLIEATGSDLAPEYRPQEKILVAHRVGSTGRAEELLGFRARVSLDEGLPSTVQWWKEHGRGADAVQSRVLPARHEASAVARRHGEAGGS